MPLKGRSQRGIFPIVTGTESVKATQLEETRNAAATPSEGTKSVHNVLLYDTVSHQPLYLKEILMQKVSKNWEGFNS